MSTVFNFFDVSAGGFGKLDTATAPSSADTSTRVAWEAFLNTGNGFSIDQITYGSTVTGHDGDLNNPAAPSGGNGLRTLNPLTGTFATGAWTLNAEIRDVVTDFTTINYRFRVWRSTNSTGSGATELTSGFVSTTGLQASTTAGTINGSTSSITSFTLHNEYLFVTISVAANADIFQDMSGTSILRTGGTNLTSPTFTPADFTIASSPSTQTINRGQGTTYTETITAFDGFVNNVTLTLVSPPTGISGSFSPNPVTGGSGSSTLTITTTGAAPLGTTSLVISATDGTLIHTSGVNLVLLATTSRSLAATGVGT
jgi:hypothetical protein